jgi:putative SOS response-associated peptidase YedK
LSHLSGLIGHLQGARKGDSVCLDQSDGRTEGFSMCNLYNHTTSVEAMRQLFDGLENLAGNVETGDVYPDRSAPIITRTEAGHALRRARWGLPSPQQFHSKSGIDRGVTNVRNTGSPHWRRWLGSQNRCLVPVTKFAEPRPGGRGAGNAWFAPATGDPMFFAGIWVPGWTSIRKLKDGETTDDLCGFLTSEPNAEVRAIHPRAMPVILTEPEEWATWLAAPWREAQQLQQPLWNGALVVVSDEAAAI